MPSFRSAQHKHPLIALLCLLLLTTAWSAPLPVSELFEHPALALPKVSANGKLLALRAEIEQKQYLALMDLSLMKLNLVAKFDETKLRNIMWKGDDLLLLIVENSDGSSEFRSYDLKTQKVQFLSAGRIFHSATLLCTLPHDPENVVVQIDSVNGVNLSLLNIRTGKFITIEKPSSDAMDWIVNREGKPVATYCFGDKKYYMRWRSAEDQPWQKRDLGVEGDPRIVPFAVYSDQKRLLAWDSTDSGTKSVVILDPATMETKKLFQHPDVDPDDVRYWGDDRTDLLAILFDDGQPRLRFLDAEAARLQASVDAALPETFNEIRSVSNDRQLLVILSWSDRHSGTHYVLDRRSNRISLLGPMFPNQNPTAMGTSQAFAFKSKDGLKIHGRLLLPPGKPKTPPLVLMVGPELAGSRAPQYFDTEQQLYATRGYAVARIDYRGCSGYGRSFLQAGNYQFATGMVDDLLAGVDYLATQGLIDSDRVSLLTKDWGGIVGLSALARSDRFKLWLNHDTFLELKSFNYSDLVYTPRKDEEIVADLGGKKAARQFLKELFPINRLPQIKIPSFHVYPRTASQGTWEDSDKISQYLKKHPGLGQVVNVTFSSEPKDSIRYEIEANEKMLEFLAQHMPVKVPPP
jgi:dipeptidyl aminopeptidase/acylaminoacyl peptidase